MIHPPDDVYIRRIHYLVAEAVDPDFVDRPVVGFPRQEPELVIGRPIELSVAILDQVAGGDKNAEDRRGPIPLSPFVFAGNP